MNNKILPFYIVTTILIFFLGIYSTNIIKDPTYLFSIKDSISIFVPFFLILYFVLSFYVFGIILSDNKLKKYFILILSLSYLLGILLRFSTNLEIIVNELILVSSLLGLTMLIGLFVTSEHIESSYSNLIKPKIFYTTTYSTRLLLLILPIALTISAYFSAKSIEIQNMLQDRVVEYVTEYTLNIVSGSIRNNINTSLISQNQTINNSISNSTLIINQIGSALENQLGIKIDASQLSNQITLQNGKIEIDLSDQIRPIIKQKVEEIISPYFKYLPILIALLQYFSISTLILFTRFLMSVFTWIILRILLATGYIKEEKSLVEVNKLAL